jgi:hypothetical protein
VLNLSAKQVGALPVDQLGLVILDDLIATGEWNEYNYLLQARRTYEGKLTTVKGWSVFVAETPA